MISFPEMSSTFSSYSIQIIFIFLMITKGILGTTFTIVNKCNYVVWPGILSSAGTAKLDSTGFELAPGASRSFQAPSSWSGRFWARTGCKFDPSTGQGSCETGDCGSNQVECNGAGANPPATLAEFTVGSGPDSGSQDFYDVSLVDGYNLPMIVEAVGGSGSCLATGCITDLNRMCPNELRVGEGQACNSACKAFGTPEYCCDGAYSSPATCKPSVYSQIFKSACPRSYSYAYDDATSTFTCKGADYMITFCSSITSQKSSRDSSSTGTPFGIGIEGSVPGSQADSSADGGSWLPDFLLGGSSSTISDCALHHTLIAVLFAVFLPLFQL